MAIELVKAMEKVPGVCFICGSTPTRDGHPLPAIDTNVDINWGENAYICSECITLAARLIGWEDPDVVEDLKSKIRKLKEEAAENEAKYAAQEKSLAKIREGSKEMKKVRG